MSSFKKNERLSGQKEISLLMKKGNVFHRHPFRIQWLVFPNDSGYSFQMKAAFSVPRRKFKKAVKRNTIKRRMKEAYRLNKNTFIQQMKDSRHSLFVLFVFTSRNELSYHDIDNGMKEA